MKEDAEKEEENRKNHEESILNFLYKNSGEFDELKKEILQPNEHQKQEKFCRIDKLALLITNCVYDEQQMGMKNLPDVLDDRKNMQYTI